MSEVVPITMNEWLAIFTMLGPPAEYNAMCSRVAYVPLGLWHATWFFELDIEVQGLARAWINEQWSRRFEGHRGEQDWLDYWAMALESATSRIARDRQRSVPRDEF